MKFRLLFYGASCAALALSVWLYHVHFSRHAHQAAAPLSASPLQSKLSATQLAAAPVSAGSHTAASGRSSPVITAIDLVLDDRVSIQQRLSAIKDITGKLSDADRAALYDFLGQRATYDDDQLGQVLKNRLMDALCDLSPPPPGLGELLARIYHDPGQNIVLRDYAVQHLVPFYRQMAAVSDMDPQVRDQELQQTREIFWDALNDTGSSIAGTALLGLSRLARENRAGFDQNKIGDTAMKLASDSNASELSRVTAFQVCANLGITKALPTILAAAQNGETIPVQISAIGALGALGGPDQVPFLNRLIQGNVEWLKLPAQHALLQIQSRLQQQAQAKTS